MKRLLLALLVLAVATTQLHTSEGSPLLGGLLGGGGEGQGGLLGGLLGGGEGGGLLGGLLGGGEGGGLLGGLLGGEGGLVGGLLSGLGLDKLLQQILCLLERLGLDIVLQLLNGLGVDALLGLNALACREGGGKLLDFLFSAEGLLGQNGIIDVTTVLAEVLCVVDDAGLETVNDLIDQLDVDELLYISEYICKGGDPLFGKGKGGAILGILSSKGGLLGGLLSGGLDLQVLIGDLLCFADWNGLETVNDLVDQLEVDELLGVSEYICKNGKPLFSAADMEGAVGILSIGGLLSGILDKGLDLQAVLGDLLCVLKWNGLEGVTDLVDELGVDDLLAISNYICKDGNYLFNSDKGKILLELIKSKDGPFGDLLKGDLLGEILCFIRGTGLQLEQVIDLIDQMGVDNFLSLSGYVCKNDRPIFPTGEGQVLGLIFEESMRRGLNIEILVGNLLCVLRWSGLQGVAHFVDKLGVVSFLEICDFVCKDGQFLFTKDEGDVLLWILLSDEEILRGFLKGDLDIELLLGDVLCFVQGMGVQAAFNLFEQLGVDEILNLSGYFCHNGKPVISAEEGQVLIGILAEGDCLGDRDLKSIVGDLLCVSKWSGLQALVDLVDRLGVNGLLDIFDYVCKDGKFLFSPDEGNALLAIFQSNKGGDLLKGGIDLRLLLGNVLCIVQGSDLQTAIALIDQLGVSGFLSFSGYLCKNGAPLFSAYEGGVLLDILFGKGLLGGLNIKVLLGDLLCILRWGGLQAVIDLVDELGADNLLGIGEYICKDGEPLFSDEEGEILLEILLYGKGLLTDLLKNGIDLKAALTKLLCIVKGLGLDTVLDVVDGLGVDELLGLVDAVCENGLLLFTAKGNSLLQFILSDDGSLNLDILDQILCLLKSLKLEGVLKLLGDLGLNEVLGLYERVCPDGDPLMNFECEDTGFLASLGLNNVFDLTNIMEKLLCLTKQLDLTIVLDLLQSLGLAEMLNMENIVCPSGLPLIEFASLESDEKVIIAKITKAVGTDKLDWLIEEYGMDTVVQIGVVVEINGVIHADKINKLLCIIEALGADNVIDLVESSSLNNVLVIYGTVCPRGIAIRPGASVNKEVLAQLLVMCERGDSACQRALDAAFSNPNYYCLRDVCPCCEFLQSKNMRDQCETSCDDTSLCRP